MTIQYLVGNVFLNPDLASLHTYLVRYHLADGSDQIEGFTTYTEAFLRWLAISDSLEAERDAKLK